MSEYSPRGDNEPVESWITRHIQESNRNNEATEKKVAEIEETLTALTKMNNQLLQVLAKHKAEKELLVKFIKWLVSGLGILWAVLIWGKEHIRW